tara:strand:- start:2550 stop:2939 length:390 start_codon:yes stop_codon:yes gene_type:complete
MATTIEIAGRDALLGMTKRRYAEIKCGDVTFRLQSLTEAEKSRFEKSILTAKGKIKDDARRRLLVATLVDSDGERLLTDADLRQLSELDGKVSQKLAAAAMEHTGFTDSDMDDLEKNSDSIHEEGSYSD